MMSSRPDYVAAWLGISSVGGVVALINAQLVGVSLAHCINVANADHVILATVFEAARAQQRTPKIWMHGDASLEDRSRCYGHAPAVARRAGRGDDL